MIYKFPATKGVKLRTVALLLAIFLATSLASPKAAIANNFRAPTIASAEVTEGAPKEEEDAKEQPGFTRSQRETETQILDQDGDGAPGTPSTPAEPPRYDYIWVPVSEFSGCGADLDGGSWSCTPHPDSCEAGNGSQVSGTGDALVRGDSNAATVEGVTQRGTRIDLSNPDAEPVDLGIRCAMPGTPEYEEAPPVVITVTREDFARLPVEPLPAHAGPVDGWLPVNMVNVLYVEPETQLLQTELLDTPVAIRATPVSYHWDLGDGNTITTSNPGKPYPSETVSATYTQEGWYDITLTTTFSGQFSVAGGPWQDIDGTIDVVSTPSRSSPSPSNPDSSTATSPSTKTKTPGSPNAPPTPKAPRIPPPHTARSDHHPRTPASTTDTPESSEHAPTRHGVGAPRAAIHHLCYARHT